MKWGIEKTDSFAKEYLEYSEAREVLDLLRAKISEQQLFDSAYKLNDWDAFLKDHPDFKDKSRKQVEEETKKYTFKNIVRFLNDQFKQGGANFSEFLGKFLIDYSNLSSFVHGGMKSYQEMMLADTEEKRRTEYSRICGLTFQMSASIKLFSLMMYIQTDSEDFTSHYWKLDGIMKRINTEKAST